MKKELPKVKKTLKSFILNEDAKVIDKTTIKVALVGSFMAFSLIASSEDVHAGKHKSHTDHNNHVFHESEIDENIISGKTSVQKIDNLNNEGTETITTTRTVAGVTRDIEVQGKSVASAHGNHYNHADGKGKGM